MGLNRFMKSLSGPFWTLGDILDYEYPADMSGMARDIRRWAGGYSGSKHRNRRFLAWVRQRQGAGSKPLPGYLVQKTYSVIGLAVFAFGLLAGMGLGWGVLAYGGGAAVNLIMALSVLVALPLLLTAVSLILSMMPTSSRRGRHLMDRFQRVVVSAFNLAKGLGVVEQSSSDIVQAGIARLQERSSRYLGVLRWSSAVPIQLRGLSFHLGVFLAVFWRGVVQDLAFAWQTTLDVPAERIHQLASAIARPWTSIIPPPSLEQVAGSRVILKEGLSALDNSALVSWWPFLCGAVVVYGVIPRLVLWLHGVLRRAAAGRSLAFRDSRGRLIESLMDREDVEVTGLEARGSDRPAITDGLADGRLLLQGRNLHVVYPANRSDLAEGARWEAMFPGCRLEAFHASPAMDDEDDQTILEGLRQLDHRRDGVLLICEGWRPYTEGFSLYLQALLRTVPPRLPVVVGLAGREAGFESRDDESLVQWRRRLAEHLDGDASGFLVIGEPS